MQSRCLLYHVMNHEANACGVRNGQKKVISELCPGGGESDFHFSQQKMKLEMKTLCNPSYHYRERTLAYIAALHPHINFAGFAQTVLCVSQRMNHSAIYGTTMVEMNKWRSTCNIRDALVSA